MILKIKINKEYRTLNVSEEDVKRLEDADVMGKRFIKLGNQNYNMNLIEYWWVEEEQPERRRPSVVGRPKGEVL